METHPLRAWSIFAIIIVAALPAANTLNVTVEHDTWWHLAVAKSIVDNGHVPQVDPFSRMSQEQPTPWRAYSWLFELGFYAVYQLAGLEGILWLRSLLTGASTAVVFAYWFRNRAVTPVHVLLLVPLAVTLMPLSTERPWHFSIMGCALTAWVATALREGMPFRHALWLPLYYILWANIHIQFVLGWGILGLMVLFPGVLPRRQAIVLTIMCTLAVLVNPYHWHLFVVIWEYATQGAPLKLVQELSTPNPLANPAAGTWALAGVTLLIASVVRILRERKWDLFEIGLLVAATIFAVRMNRDLWFLGIAAATVLRPRGPICMRWFVIPCITLGVFLVVRLVYAVGFQPLDVESAQARKYPVQAVRFLQSERVPGPIFNDFDWGGYVIWNAPEYPVSIDGRTNLYGNERMLLSFGSWSTEAGRHDDPSFQEAKCVLAPKERVLTYQLRESPDWIIGYEDELSVVFVRKGVWKPRLQ